MSGALDGPEGPRAKPHGRAPIAAGPLAALLRDPNYLRMWLAGVCSGVSRWLETLVLGIFTFEVTGSPFLVAFLMVARLVPIGLFGPLVGTLADRSSPRFLLLLGFLAGLCVSGSVFLLLAAGYTDYWIAVIASVASGIVWMTDMPLRRRMVGDLAGKERLVPAVSFDSATGHATRVVGPALGGIIYEWLGPPGAFAVTTCLYIFAVTMILQLTVGAGVKSAAVASIARIVRDFAEAFRFVARNSDVMRILLTTLVFDFFGLPFLSMIPVIGKEELLLDPAWVGAIAALEGAGALVGALLVATTTIAFNFRRLYLFGGFIYLALAFVIGFMTHVLPAGILLFCTGLAVAGFSAMQSALVYAVAPPEMRSRLFGLLMLCIGFGLFGMLNMGLMGELFGGAGAVRIASLEGMLGLVAVAVGWRQLWLKGS